MVLGQDSDFIYCHAYSRCSSSHIHSRFRVCLFGSKIGWMENFRKKNKKKNFFEWVWLGEEEVK